jgi:hypothetical protein
MSQSLEFFCGVWNRKSEQKVIPATKSRVVQPVGVDPGADVFRIWKCTAQDDVTFFGFNQ